jgi:hypothetical protein
MSGAPQWIAVPANMTDWMRNHVQETDKRIELILQIVGANTVAYLRSLTTVRRPPVRKGEGERWAHPGGWADISSNLANAYAFEVRQSGAGWELVLSNHMEYAAYLEAKDGYFVLSGVTEPGGPVEQAIRDAVAEVAPGWVVRYG